MMLSGCSLISGATCMNYQACKTKSYKSIHACIPCPPARAQFSSVRSSWGHHHELRPCSPPGIPLLGLSAASSPLLRGDLGGLTHKTSRLPLRRHSLVSPRATSDDVPKSWRFPPMEKKPRFWWRILACITYIMPVHEGWMYAETAYHLHPFLEDFEYATYPFLKCLGRLSRWFLLIYFITLYLGVVRRKEWPHFVRFHVVTGMLLEIGLQVFGTFSKTLPRSLYWGKFGMHFWTVVAFGFLFTVLACIRCALSGMYADIPFVSDAAYIQIPYD